MDMNVEKHTISSSLTQADVVASPILCQCLYVIQTVSEFKNLTYRVTKTWNDVEVVVVYREEVLGVFGPPADPITLTLDPKGRCLLTILFKPIQRVCIVSPESGQIDIASLLMLLRLIAGNGYLFCPGIPERFLAGKVCGKEIMLHKVPFKRYQSAQCPVYYQAPTFQQNSKKSSLCALCPRCMQAAKWVYTLPTIASNTSGTVTQQPVVHPIVDQLKSDQKHVFENISSSNYTITQTNDSPTGNTDSVRKLLSLSNYHNNMGISASSESLTHKNNINSSPVVSGVDMNGNSQTIAVAKDSHKFTVQKAAVKDTRATSGDENVQILRTLLRKLLQDGCKRKSVDSPDFAKKIEGINSDEETGKLMNYNLEKSKHETGNVCHHCKKQYSTPAQLMNHVQRHEAMSDTLQKKFKELKLRRKPNFFSSTAAMVRRLKVHSAMNKKKSSHLSDTTIRLFLKHLNNIISWQNEAPCLKEYKYNVKEDKVIKHETADKQNGLEKQQFVSLHQIESKTVGAQSGSKQTPSGLSPMQTLLEAAAIAEVDNAESNCLLPSHISFTTGKYQEAAVVSTTSQLPIVSTEPLEFSVPQKKQRKSTRLASKREKNNRKRTRDNDDDTEMIEAEDLNVSHEQSMLTNLNLLSTVSLETAMRQAPINPQIQTSVSSSIPLTVLPPESKKNTADFPYSVSTNISLPVQKNSFPVHPTSKSTVNTSQKMINNTSGGNVVISKSQEMCRPLISTCLQINSSSLPPLPPLLFAGDVERKDIVYPLSSQTQPSQSQPVSISSILRNLVTVGNVQPMLKATETEEIKNHSPNSDCGAMDLSKPKLLPTEVNISKVEKGVDFSSLTGLPHNVAQLVAGSDNPSEVLECFLTMTKSAGIIVSENKDIKPMTATISDKQADSELQARMFASACNYRIDKTGNKSQHVHSVIASSSRITKPGKGIKSGDVASVQTDEIQCGYKWSGSGGSVKERTQMVRELVPPDVMASFLTKSQLSHTNQQQSVNMLGTPQTQTQQPSPQLIQSSMPVWSAQSKSQHPSASELALNLITIKSSETPVSEKGTPGRIEISAPSLIASSPPVQDRNSASPGSMKNILKASFTNSSGLLNQLKIRLSSAASGVTTSSPKNLQLKNLSQIISPSPLSLSSTPAPSSVSTISSPSLAAMLRQPAAATYETNHNNIFNISVTSLAQPNTISDNSVLILPREVHIKTEPIDSYSSHSGAVIMSLPLKAEKEDADVEMIDAEVNRDTDSSPAKLIVDMDSDKTIRRDVGKKLKSLASPVSTASGLKKKNNSVKYGRRHVLL